MRTFILLIVAIFLMGCEPLSDAFEDFNNRGSGDLLAPEGLLKGDDGLTLEAERGALESPAEVVLARFDDELDLPEIPDPLVAVSDVYVLQSNELRVAAHPSKFWLASAVPEGVDFSQMGIAFWMDGESDYYTDFVEEGDTSPPDIGYWEVLPVDRRNDDGRAHTPFYLLPDRPVYFVLVEGEWFERGRSDEASEDGVMRQELSSMEVSCSRKSGVNCDQETRDIFGEHILSASNDFTSYGFEEGPSEVWLRGVRKRSLARQTKLCHYSDDPEDGIMEGRYNKFSKRSITCLWPRDKRAPQFIIDSVTAGETFTVAISDKQEEVIAGVDDTPESIAKALAAKMNSGGFPTDFRRTRAIGNRVVFFASRSPSARPEAVYATAGSITTEQFDYKTLLTGVHEYFHAIQFTHDWWGWGFFDQQTFYEGSAMAAQESRGIMVRDLHRTRRHVNVPLYRGKASTFSPADGNHYNAQDWFVFVGRYINRGMEYLVDLVEARDYSDMVSLLNDAGHSPNQVLWDYLRNNFHEGFHRLDDIHKSCHNFTYRSGGSQFVEETIDAGQDELDLSLPVEPLSGSVFRVHIAQSHEDRTFLIEVSPGMGLQPAAIYIPGDKEAVPEDEQEEWGPTHTCEPGFGAAALTVPAHGSVGSSCSTSCAGGQTCHDGVCGTTVFVLAGQLEPGASSQADLTARRVDLEVEIESPLPGATFPEGREFRSDVSFVAQNHPVTVTWSIEDQVVAEQEVDSLSDTVSALIPSCPQGFSRLRVEVTDAFGATVSDTVNFSVASTGAGIGITVPEDRGWRVGDTHWLPVLTPQIPDLELTSSLLHLACGEDEEDPALWSWSFGSTNVSGATVTLEHDDFLDESDEVVPLDVTLSYGSAQRQITIRPCSALDVRTGCPDQGVTESVSEIMADFYNEVSRLRDMADIVIALEQDLLDVFGGVLPGEIPLDFPTAIANIEARGTMPTRAITQMWDALNSEDLESFRTQMETTLTLAHHDAPARVTFASNLAALAEIQVGFYSPIEAGGEGGYFMFSHAAERFAYPNSTEAVLAPARQAFLGALSTWVHVADFQTSVDDPVIMEQSMEAGAITGALEATRNVPGIPDD